MRRIALPFLAFGCGLLSLPALFAQQPGEGTRVAQPTPERLTVFPSLRLEQLTVTRDRPLFAPDRRPQAPKEIVPAYVPPPPEKRPPDFTLRGIISDGATIFVLLEDNSTSETISVRPGGTIGPWQVMVGANGRVTLVGGGEEIRLRMFEEGAEASK